MEIELIRSRRKSLALEIRAGKVIVRAPLFAPKSLIDAFIRKNEEWIRRQFSRSAEQQSRVSSVNRLTEAQLAELKKQAKTVFAERVDYFAPLVGVHPGRITIRAQKTKWGSCSSKKNLNFNCLLLLAPDEVLDSVVVHELCHLKQLNHSSAFYQEVFRVFPNYRQCDKWLKEHGTELMARLPE